MRFPADRRQHFFPADRRKSHFFGSTAASTLLCANPYCIPALHACTSTMFKQFLGVFQHFPCAHPCCTPALLACIPTMFKHFLWTLLLCHSTFLCAHPYCTPALSACIPTMFKHFLACISIFTCARSCCIPALPHAENYPKVVSCLAFPLQVHYISIIVPSHFHCISCISFPAFLFHCIFFKHFLLPAT